MDENYKCLEDITTGRISRIVMGKLKIGMDLLEGIEELAKRGGVKTGVILSGIGALERGSFRNAKVVPPDYKMENKHRLFLDIEKPLELLSLTGWIATDSDGSINIHAHFMTTTVVDDKVVSLGGHLVSGTITSIKNVLVIGVIEDANIKAALDPQINQVDVQFSD